MIPSSGAWNAIAEGGLAEALQEAIEHITIDLSRLDPSRVRCKSDVALYFAYLSRSTGGAAAAQSASRWLDAAIEDLEVSSLGPELFGGVTATAWAVQHVDRVLAMALEEPTADDDPDSPDALADIDSLLMTVLEQGRRHAYDLISGVVGFGVYFRERLPRPSAKRGLERVIDGLQRSAERAGDALCWHTPAMLLPDWQRQLAPQGYYNLGMAHGIPGVISLLAHCIEADVARDRSRDVIDGAVRWMLGQRRTAPARYFFDPWIAPGAGGGTSRLAWCYGDPGVAISFLLAGQATANQAWIDTATAMMSDCATRSREEAGVNDGGLCHGAAGLAHLYNRFFQATGDTRFRAAACEWLAATLQLKGDGGYGGFRSYFPQSARQDGGEPWRDDASFLTGSVGIGLALLAAVTDVPPDWQRLLLTA